MSEPWLTITLALPMTLAPFLAVWALSLRTHDAGAVDIIWGPGFALIAWWAWLRLEPAHGSATVLLLAVTLWAARLGAHLLVRHRRSRGEDARYAAMRAGDGERFPWTSLYKVFGLQALILWVLALPIHMAMAAGMAGTPGWLSAAGLALFAIGLAIESAADLALLRFKADPAQRGKLLTTGLFAWSRHPNYFGECVLWFGIGLIAWDASGSALALIGPAMLTALILKVSGPPLLEAHLAATRPGYADYAKRTSAVLPWPPKPPGGEA